MYNVVCGFSAALRHAVKPLDPEKKWSPNLMALQRVALKTYILVLSPSTRLSLS